MEVYLEMTYLMNALSILLTFEILCFLLGIQISKKKLCLYVLTYNISFILLFIDFFDGFLFVYFLILTFFYFQKQIYIYYPLYIFIYLSVLTVMQWLVPSAIIFQGILLIEGFHIHLVMILGVFALIITYFYIYSCRERVHNKLVKVTFHDKQCYGFIDTGNKVTYKGCPVIFLNQKLVLDYPVIDCIWVDTAHCTEKVDLIMIPDITIHHFKLHHVYAGIISSDMYECILNQQLLGGLL